MHENDLIPGDIIFFENNYKDEDMRPSHDYIDHVAVYDGLNEQGLPMIIHSITSERGYYYPESASGLCKTTLRSLINQVQKEEGYPDLPYDVTYKVFRCKNDGIRDKALAIIRSQARFRIPYDEKRLDEKIAREDNPANPLDANGFKNLGIAQYRTAGIYRSIKYAARYPSLLTRTRGNGIGRGVTCSMAVILSWQIAELIIDKKIHSFSTEKWPSDKYAPIPSNNKYPQAYLNYLYQLRKNSGNRTTEPDLKLSYDLWLDKNCLPEEYTHKSFAVDAKIIGAAGMFEYMLENHEIWDYTGILHAENRRFSFTDKKIYKQQSIDAFFSSLGDVREHSRTRISPASSPYALPELTNVNTELDDQGGIWIDTLLNTSNR